MRKIKEPPEASSIVIISLKGFKVGALGYYRKDNDIWYLWAIHHDVYSPTGSFQDLDKAKHAWRPVEENLLSGWEYLGAGSVGPMGTFDVIQDSLDKLFNRNVGTRGHGVLVDGWHLTAKIGKVGTKKWCEAYRRTDAKPEDKIVRVRVLP